jgi:hypothetical protein
MRKRYVALALAVAAVLGAAGATTATTPPPSRLGVYTGPGNVKGVADFQKYLGRSQVDATDYVDPSENQLWNRYAFSYWGNWKKAAPDRQFTLGLHLIPKGGNFAAGLAGKYDSQFQGVADLMAKNGLSGSVIRLGYEGNNHTIGPWQGTSDPTSYKKMWRRAHQVMERRADFKWDFNSAIGPSGKVTSFDTLYPGDDVVDIVGFNIYDVWWKHPATPADRWAHIRATTMGLNDFLAFAARHNKPYSFPEWGLYKPGDDFAGGGDNPYFIARMAELMPSARYQAYFNLDWGGGVLSDFPNGQAEFKKRFQ